MTPNYLYITYKKKKKKKNQSVLRKGFHRFFGPLKKVSMGFGPLENFSNFNVTKIPESIRCVLPQVISNLFKEYLVDTMVCTIQELYETIACHLC